MNPSDNTPALEASGLGKTGDRRGGLDTYQPGSRYWLFQGIELTIFLLLSAALIAFAMWWVKRRIS